MARQVRGGSWSRQDSLEERRLGLRVHLVSGLTLQSTRWLGAMGRSPDHRVGAYWRWLLQVGGTASCKSSRGPCGLESSIWLSSAAPDDGPWGHSKLRSCSMRAGWANTQPWDPGSELSVLLCIVPGLRSVEATVRILAFITEAEFEGGPV